MVNSRFDIVNFGMGHRYCPQEEVANVSCRRSIGMVRMAAADAAKHLTATISFLHTATSSTVTGSVSGRHFSQTNTVLLAKLFKPTAHPSHCPVGETSIGSTAKLSSLAVLDSLKCLNGERAVGRERQLLQALVYVLVPRLAGTPSTLRVRRAPLDIVPSLSSTSMGVAA